MTISNSNRAILFLTTAVLATIVLATRRPDIIYQPAPWAEDGVIWIKQIYDDGVLSSLFRPQDGYFQTISRLSYGLGMQFGLERAPLIATLVALTIRVAFIVFILSSRFSFANINFRIVLASYFLLMPGLQEGFINVTNAHWYLAIYLIAVMMAHEPQTIYWRTHDYIILLLSGLSGPFIVFAACAHAIKKLFIHRSINGIVRSINAFDITLSVLFLIQVSAILLTSGGRSPAPLGASIQLLVDIVTNRVVIGSLWEGPYQPALSPFTSWTAFTLLVSLSIYGVLKGGWRVAAPLTFVVVFLFFALAKPMVSNDTAQWPHILTGAAQRYFFMVNFAFCALILFSIYTLGKLKWIALGFIIVVCTPILLSTYRIPPVPGTAEYKQDVATFNALPYGEVMDVRIAPSGWVMTLEKR